MPVWVIHWAILTAVGSPISYTGLVHMQIQVLPSNALIWDCTIGQFVKDLWEKTMKQWRQEVPLETKDCETPKRQKLKHKSSP